MGINYSNMNARIFSANTNYCVEVNACGLKALVGFSIHIHHDTRTCILFNVAMHK